MSRSGSCTPCRGRGPVTGKTDSDASGVLGLEKESDWGSGWSGGLYHRPCFSAEKITTP
jgi:hypothetical protein